MSTKFILGATGSVLAHGRVILHTVQPTDTQYARLAVRAMNSHEATLVALREALPLLEAAEFRDAAIKVRAAIALAEARS